ncbi:AimR family lysis-lysogeny pheromone receptor [Bacillus horti]|uniref:Transcriptional regulator with XRE-family HTH domain n=1 Tax=Caldalkalibacillus horti TaxID=77523 RepID=A0ABT9W624_9BACI|nr:AimR family lysis-lysogeny pheromone receptor [Bacillus horti]MDQ0168300.1 transcriptional regulator with XRE-family HTH domain [Bacillus horti]
MLRERIVQTLEKQNNIDQRKLSRIAGLSESSISRFLHGFEEANFEAVFKMVKYLYPAEELEIMTEYMITQKSRNLRFSLEYCSLNHLQAPFDIILEELSQSENRTDKEWASMYRLLHPSFSSTADPLERLHQVEMFKPKELEMQILKSIVKGHLYYDLREYQALVLHTLDVEAKIRKVKSSFIKDTFRVRLGLLMSVVHLYSNNLEKAREFSFSVLNQNYFEKVKGRAYNQLGYSYMLDDYDQSIMYLKEALTFFTVQKNIREIEDIKINLTFLKLFWKLDQPISNCTDYINDYNRYELNNIYYLIRLGDSLRAKQLLDDVDLTGRSHWELAFYWYYKGLLTNDVDCYYRSVSYFIKLDDYFHQRLPLAELQKLGENEIALKLLSRKGDYIDKDYKANYS